MARSGALRRCDIALLPPASAAGRARPRRAGRWPSPAAGPAVERAASGDDSLEFRRRQIAADTRLRARERRALTSRCLASVRTALRSMAMAVGDGHKANALRMRSGVRLLANAVIGQRGRAPGLLFSPFEAPLARARIQIATSGPRRSPHPRAGANDQAPGSPFRCGLVLGERARAGNSGRRGAVDCPRLPPPPPPSPLPPPPPLPPTAARPPSPSARRIHRRTTMAQQGQGFDFEKRPTERPHPAHYLKKREGSPGGLKQPPATRSASPGARIPAHHGGASPGATAAAPFKVSGSTLFRKRYDRGELPVRVDQGRPGRNGLRWTADLASLDLHLYLPIFVEGLQETQASQAGWRTLAGACWAEEREGGTAAGGRRALRWAARQRSQPCWAVSRQSCVAPQHLPCLLPGNLQEPFRMLARQGVQELLEGSPPERVLPVIPQVGWAPGWVGAPPGAQAQHSSQHSHWAICPPLLPKDAPIQTHHTVSLASMLPWPPTHPPRRSSSWACAPRSSRPTARWCRRACARCALCWTAARARAPPSCPTTASCCRPWPGGCGGAG